MTGQLSPLAQGKAAGTAGYTSKLLKTGQTTQYDSELDDGYYEAGVAKSYTINTTGDQSGTSNVVLAHYAGAAGAISFNNTTHKITDSGNGLAIFKTNDVILTSSANNPGPFTVTTGNVAGEIVCSGATFTDETPAGVVTISKRASMSNNTVLDNKTGLEWMRYYNEKMGSVSNGTMPWTGKLYDIFAWCAACNTANVGGHNDWRVPNRLEALSLLVHVGSVYPDATAFPTGFANERAFFTSTTYGQGTTYAYSVSSKTGNSSQASKTNENSCYCFLLVRGGLS